MAVIFDKSGKINRCLLGGVAGEDMGRKVVPVTKPAERMVHGPLVPAADGDAGSEVSSVTKLAIKASALRVSERSKGWERNCKDSWRGVD